MACTIISGYVRTGDDSYVPCVLLGKQKRGQNALLYNLPAGKVSVEDGNDRYNTAVRELYEEFGIFDRQECRDRVPEEVIANSCGSPVYHCHLSTTETSRKLVVGERHTHAERHLRDYTEMTSLMWFPVFELLVSTGKDVTSSFAKAMDGKCHLVTKYATNVTREALCNPVTKRILFPDEHPLIIRHQS